MKKIFFLSIACVLLVFTSCNKDQSAVRKLDGTWNVSKSESTTGAVTVNNLQFVEKIEMNFNECKLKTDTWCTGSVAVTALGFTSTDDQVFRVTGKGTTLEVKESVSSNTISTITITELTKSSLKLSEIDGNTTTITEAQKQD